MFKGELPWPQVQSPSISYRLDDQVGEISIGELLALIDTRVESGFAEREYAPRRGNLSYPSKLKPHELSQGVRDAADYVARKNDPAMLEKFLGKFPKFPQDQRAVIEAYLAQRVTPS
jgi:hypothetical protein